MGRKKRLRKGFSRKADHNTSLKILIVALLIIGLLTLTLVVFVLSLNRFILASPSTNNSSFVRPRLLTSTPYQSGGAEYHKVIKSVLKKAATGLPEAEELYDFLVENAFESEQYLLVRDLTRTVGLLAPDNSFLFTLSRVPWQSRGPFAAYNRRTRSLAVQDEVINQNILAMLVMHELKHARDDILFNLLVDYNLNDDRYIDDEYRAYELEMKLGNNLSKGVFFRKSDQIIARYNLSYQKPLYSLNDDIFKELNMVFGPTISSSEVGYREAIYLIALQIRLFEKTNLEEEPRRSAWRGWYREFLKRYGTNQ